MTRFIAALALACALLCSTAAEARHRRRATCAPTFLEGVGTVWICARRPRQC